MFKVVLRTTITYRMYCTILYSVKSTTDLVLRTAKKLLSHAFRTVRPHFAPRTVRTRIPQTFLKIQKHPPFKIWVGLSVFRPKTENRPITNILCTVLVILVLNLCRQVLLRYYIDMYYILLYFIMQIVYINFSKPKNEYLLIFNIKSSFSLT